MDEQNNSGVDPGRVGAKKPLEQTTDRNQRYVREHEAHKKIYSALGKAAGDPLKLKEIIGAKTVAEVYRTLDKLTIRREFHDAMTKAGITFDFLIEGIKREAIGGDKSMDRLKAYEMLLKTLGLDKYDDLQTGSTSSWEERLLKAIQGHEGVLETDVTPRLKEAEKNEDTKAPDYEVVVPEIPKSVVEEKKKEALTFHDFPRPK